MNSLKGLSLQVLKYWPSGEECPVHILCACGVGTLEADKCKAVFSWCWGSEGVVPGGKALRSIGGDHGWSPVGSVLAERG